MKRAMFLLLFVSVISVCGGCSSEGTSGPFYPNFKWEQDTQLPLTIKFTDQTLFTTPHAIKIYTWTFGEGDVGSFEINPTFTYLRAGTYDVTLTVCAEIVFCNSVKHAVTVQ